MVFGSDTNASLCLSSSARICASLQKETTMQLQAVVRTALLAADEIEDGVIGSSIDLLHLVAGKMAIPSNVACHMILKSPSSTHCCMNCAVPQQPLAQGPLQLAEMPASSDTQSYQHWYDSRACCLCHRKTCTTLKDLCRPKTAAKLAIGLPVSWGLCGTPTLIKHTNLACACIKQKVM